MADKCFAVDGWQPMETAPKDGTWIIAVGYSIGIDEMFVGYIHYAPRHKQWCGGSFACRDGRSWVSSFEPRCWRPLEWPTSEAVRA